MKEVMQNRSIRVLQFVFTGFLLIVAAWTADSAETGRLANHACTVTVAGNGRLGMSLPVASGQIFQVTVTPAYRGEAVPAVRTTATPGKAMTVFFTAGEAACSVDLRLREDGCVLSTPGPDVPPGWSLSGEVSGVDAPLCAARVALDSAGEPTVHGGGDVLDIAVGRASNRRMNTVYTLGSFRGVLLNSGGEAVDLHPMPEGYSFRFSGGRLAIRALDVWSLIGWRPALRSWTFDHPEVAKPHVIPREWMARHRPFPWKTFSPVQLPFISTTNPEDFGRVKEQIDFLAENLRDWGFFCFGEWPLTQQNPDYTPPGKEAYLAGTRRTCDYAHGKGIRILRWVTDPDIQPRWYPKLHEKFAERGWFSHKAGDPEWLLDYTNPGVQQWLEQQYADLAATGPDFYWVDNNHPTRPLHAPDRFPPDAFREFYLAIQRGLLSTGRNDILIRSGASAWADYSAAGVLDVYAPGPDVQNDWTEQQISVARELTRRDYLCHFNLWRRCIDDFFPAGPQTTDQTRAMATLLGLTGLGFTVTDIGLPKIPSDRLRLLRQLVPIAVTRPMDLYRFTRGGLPHWWVLNRRDQERHWQVAGVFNWGLEAEQVQFASFDDLGLDPANECLVYDFWSQRATGRFRGGIGLRVAPTSGPALAIHPVGNRPFVVATDRHVTMGAAELANSRWDAAKRTLFADFIAGVKTQTFHLTFFCPDALVPESAAIGGKSRNIDDVGDGLFQIPIPCDGPVVRITIRFKPGPLSPVMPPSASPPAYVLDLDAAPVLRKTAHPGIVTDVLARARRGETILLAAPKRGSDELGRLQAALNLHWGLYRPPTGSHSWLLTVPGDSIEVPADLLFRSACIGFAPNTARALLDPVGRGMIVVLRPYDGTAEWRRLAQRLKTGPIEVLQQARVARAAFRRAITSAVGPFQINPERTQGTAPLRAAGVLQRVALGFHFRRLSRSMIAGAWSVPRISVQVNGQDLPHTFNPCRPESPPQNWDSLYFGIPKGLLRFDGSDRVTIQSKVPVKDAEAFQADLQRGLELVIKTPEEVGENLLTPLPAFAIAPPFAFDALLGLDGGARFLAGEGADLAIEGGTPYNGWPSAPGGVTHCVFAEDHFSIVVRVPKGLSGTLEAYAFDHEAYRREEIVFEGRNPVEVEKFGGGKWLRFPFTAADTANSDLRITVRNLHGGNCVLSRVRIRPAGSERSLQHAK